MTRVQEKVRELYAIVKAESEKLRHEQERVSHKQWMILNLAQKFYDLMKQPDVLSQANNPPQGDEVYQKLERRHTYNIEKEKENGGIKDEPSCGQGGSSYPDTNCPAYPFFERACAFANILGRMNRRNMGAEEYYFLKRTRIDKLERILINNFDWNIGTGKGPTVELGYWKE